MPKKQKSYSEIRKEDVPVVKYPSSTAHYIEIQSVSADGIFYMGRDRYTKSYAFTDNNYPLYAEDDQDNLLTNLAKIYNSSSCDLELSVINVLVNKEKNKSIKLQRVPGTKEEAVYVNELQQMINDRRILSDKVTTVKLFTVTMVAGDYEIARNRFITHEMSMLSYFSSLNSKVHIMTTDERIQLIHAIQNPGCDPLIITDLNKRFIRETLALKSFGYDKDILRLVGATGTWYARLLYIKDFSDTLEDNFLTSLTQMQIPMSFSMHARGVEKSTAKEMLQLRLDRVRRKIDKEQDNNNKAGHFHTEISRPKLEEQKELNSMLDDLSDDSEHLFVASFTVCIYGRSREELDGIEENIMNLCQEKSVAMAEHEIKLREAYVTSLPLGVRMVRTLRPMFSTALSAINPFGAQDVNEDGAFYYGVNYLTKRLIMLDRRQLHPAHGLIVGKSNSGKSLYNKMEKLQVYLYTNDEIIIVDPMSEYKKLVQNLGGTFYECGAGGSVKFNPLAINGNITEKAIEKKSILMNAFMSVILKEDFRAAHQDVLERAVRNLYHSDEPKSMTCLKEKLKDITHISAAAGDLVLAMDRLTEGTLNIFTDDTAGVRYSRITAFGLGNKVAANEEQIAITMMAVLDYITDRITYNDEANITTWLDVDEIQRILPLKKAAEMFNDFWQTARKLRTVCTALTTTVRNLNMSHVGGNIISSTGFKAVFRLEQADREDAKREFELKETQLNYIRNADLGSAVLKIDTMFLQMESMLTSQEKQTQLYRMITTNPYDDD